MSEAVKTINRIDDQDFTRLFIVQRIEGPTWSTYFSFNVSGFSLENTFRDLGLNDFDLALDCLEKPPTKEPPKRAKAKRASRS
jgi:hypothetical protein